MSFHQPHHHYDHFVFNHDSIDQAAMTAPCANEISLIPLEWLDDFRSLVLPPQGLNLLEDAVLPPHEPIAGRTVDMSICPTTTCTQTWGGRSTYHHMNSNMGRSVWREPHRSNTPIQLELLDVEPFQCRQTNLIPIWLHNRCFIDGMIIPNRIPGIWMKWKSLPRFCSFQF